MSAIEREPRYEHRPMPRVNSAPQQWGVYDVVGDRFVEGEVFGNALNAIRQAGVYNKQYAAYQRERSA